MGKIIRPNHIVFVTKLLSYLDKYFCSSKTARRVKKYFDKHSHKICSEVRINKKHEPSTVTNYNGSWGVRQPKPGFSESQSPCEVCFFSKISVTSKYVINLKIRTNKIELSFALYNSATGNGLVRKNTSSRIVGCLRQG